MPNNTSFSVHVDNPGDFFACLGILYCADKLFGHAAGYFKEGRFVLETNHEGSPLSTIMNKINSLDADKSLELNEPKDDSAAPITLRSMKIRLDFWKHFDDRPTIKLFAGQETSKGVVERWLGHLKKVDEVKELRDNTVIDLPSGLDTATSWNALDVGFSLNDQKMKILVYPLIEFFAYIGVQTYGWRRNRDVFYYHTWQTPLPLTIARAVAAGALTLPDTQCFQFRSQKSGQKQILKKGRLVLQ